MDPKLVEDAVQETARTIQFLRDAWEDGHSKNRGATAKIYHLKEMIWYCMAVFDDISLVISPYENVREVNDVRSPFIHIPLWQPQQRYMAQWISKEIKGLRKPGRHASSYEWPER